MKQDAIILEELERRFPEAAYFYDLKFAEMTAWGVNSRGEAD